MVKRVICYDSCEDDHHRCYNHHYEDLTVSPVAGRGNVGWRPCGELDLTEFIIIFISVFLFVIIQVKIMCDDFLPKSY